MKRRACVTCARKYPLNSFPVQDATRRRTECASCWSARVALRRRTRTVPTRDDVRRELARRARERRLEAEGKRRCATCGESRELGEFPFAPTGRRQRRQECKPCWNARAALHHITGAQPARDEVRQEMRRRELDAPDFTRAELDAWELRLRAYRAELAVTLSQRVNRSRP